MTSNNPVNWTDPSGTSAIEGGGIRSMVMQAAPGIAAVGNAVSCGFSVLAGIFDVMNNAQKEGFSVQSTATYSVQAAGISLECGAGTKAIKRMADSCGGSIIKQIAFLGAGFAAANIDFLLQYANPVRETRKFSAARAMWPSKISKSATRLPRCMRKAAQRSGDAS